MAYAAVTSLYHTIDLLLSSSRTAIDPSSQKTLKDARWVAQKLQETLREYDDIKNSSEEVLAVDARIRDEARKLEETIETQASTQFISQSQTSHGRFFLDLSHLSHDVSRFLQTSEKMGVEYVKELWKPPAASPAAAAAAAAVTSLYNTIDVLLSSSRTTIDPSSQKTLKYARWVAERLQETLSENDDIRNSSQEVLAVDARIRDEARKLEETIESQASVQYLSQSQTSHGRFSLDLSHLSHDVSRFLQTSEKMREEYMKELRKHSAASAAAKVDAAAKVEMVGFADLFLEVRDRIIETRSFKFIAITGMAGIGKTTFVKKLLQDSLITEMFKERAFVSVGQKYEFEEILRAIMAQLNAVASSKMTMERDDNIYEFFKRFLKDRKFLIVLDDVWDDVSTTEDFNYYNKYLLNLVPRNADSGVLLTSRIDGIRKDYSHIYQMPFLTEVESWKLMQRKVFGEEEGEGEYSCPPQLVKAGKKIAENCEGLPLLILSVSQLLIKAPKDVSYWEEVAKMRNSLFEDACDSIYEVLLTSYHYLAQRSKACFLYMCVFPRDYVVWRSKVNNLWLAEGFADGVGSILDDIVSSNLVVTRERNWGLTKAKACNLHIVNRHMSTRVAEDNKFIFVLNTYVAGGPGERIKDKPHLAVYNNSLLAMKEVHNSIAGVSTLRSMLCTGPYHQYQVPVCMELKLLRVLDAITIRFYEFPVEVVKLIQLRYLSLSTNANLPPSINKLWFLEYLIVHQHLSIIKHRDSAAVKSQSYVPMEIWEMEQLKHLQIVGRNLPPPPPGSVLSNLTTLLDVGAQSCTAQVLESLPKLEKLRIRIESAPHLAPTMPRFDHLCHEKLKSLASVVFNPKLSTKPAFPPRLQVSGFMTSLRKLSLRGFGYPWGDMSKISKISSLQVLKLQCYAFRGEKWAANSDMRFESLRYLLIEDTDLVQWIGAEKAFPELTHLTMRNCYKLHVFPLIQTLTNIQLVDCNPLAETRARKIAKCNVRVECSW